MATTNEMVADMTMKELGMNLQAQKAAAESADTPKKIGKPEIRKAIQILKKYKDGKAMLEKKLVADEEYWKQKQWRYIRDSKDADRRFEPATPWLFSCIQSRHADIMDSFPTCNIQPRQRDDEREAKILSEIIPIVLDQDNYEETYATVAWYMLKHGGCVQSVMWDARKHNGLGDISIKPIDFMNLFWEPGITDIQKSANVFTTELVDNNLLASQYPQLRGKLGGKPLSLAKYIYDEKIDTTDKSIVIDWYYILNQNGKNVLHYCKFCNEEVLYATENDTEIPMTQEYDPITGVMVTKPLRKSMATTGLYDHGKYPFVVRSLYPIEGGLCGYGLIDIGRDTQTEIDLINRAITENAIAGARPRYFSRSDGNINEEEFRDLNNTIVHVNGSMTDEAIRPIEYSPLAPVYVNVLEMKKEELKFCTANQDVNNGSAPNGITAASAISALQESSGKTARNSNKTMHRAYKDIIEMVIELIRQFYDTTRVFRIVPDAETDAEYIEYNNSGIAPQPQMMGEDFMGYRVPEFDVSVTTEKANPYKKMEINELALSFYGNGFFNPQLADQAIATLQMMDFNGKDEVIQRVRQNGSIYQTMLRYMQTSLTLAQQTGDQVLADSIAQDIMANAGQPTMSGLRNLNAGQTEEHPYVERARNTARASTQAD